MRKLILIMLLFSVSGYVLAAWEKSDVDSNGDTVYFSPASIRRSGNTVKVLVLVDTNKAGTIENSAYRSMKAEIELECARRLMRVFFLSMYSGKMGDGSIIKFGKIDNAWQLIEDGSPSVALSELACKKH